MARNSQTNYSQAGEDFDYCDADTDQFDAFDVQKLAKAVDNHTHASGKGLAVQRASLTTGLDVALGTITSDDPVVDGTGTWNAVGTTFNALKVNITDTASATASKLLDLLVGGSSKFTVRKDGAIVTGGFVWSAWTPVVTQGVGVTFTGTARYCRIGKTVMLYGQLALTSAGTAANAIVITGLPSDGQIANPLGAFAIGSVTLGRAAPPEAYTAAMMGAAAGTLKLIASHSATADYFGVDPAWTLANGDYINFSVFYEAT